MGQMGPWILVSAEGNLKQERRLIDIDYRHGEWFLDSLGSVVRIRDKQHRHEVLFCLGGANSCRQLSVGKDLDSP